MGFYDLSKEERIKFVQKMELEVKSELKKDEILENSNISKYASDDDSYIRKNLYLILSRIYLNDYDFQEKIITTTKLLYQSSDEKQRQTAVFAWGEIGKLEFDKVAPLFEMALNDNSHKVKSSIMGSLKKMGEKNPQPTLIFVQKFLNHPDPEIRRLMVHGIELRGRTHPEDVLFILHQLQNEVTPRVRNMIIHVIGQISYKEGCLETVVLDLKNWENEDLVKKSLEEIIKVHQRYNFAVKSESEAISYIKSKFGFNFILEDNYDIDRDNLQSINNK
ncbi:MAG: HEAT repeat domain-containing protein [Methanobacteriaceae archaeon]|jgi:hypothetical protein|nr:HEAT repeat domain-containing protein [Methanobacteriaceae archaeon]MDO9627431.1 HEAT repeat domain-containing protein [Methanobacteriaceae archaeon]